MGSAVLLADQDRTQWDRAAITEAVPLVGEGLRLSPAHPDPYVVQAAIAACHALALLWEETDWAAIESWYEVLLRVDDGPVVRLNHAVAVAEAQGPRSRGSTSSTRSTGCATTRSGTRPGPPCCAGSTGRRGRRRRRQGPPPAAQQRSSATCSTATGLPRRRECRCALG